MSSSNYFPPMLISVINDQLSTTCILADTSMSSKVGEQPVPICKDFSHPGSMSTEEEISEAG